MQYAAGGLPEGFLFHLSLRPIRHRTERDYSEMTEEWPYEGLHRDIIRNSITNLINNIIFK